MISLINIFLLLEKNLIHRYRFILNAIKLNDKKIKLQLFKS